MPRPTPARILYLLVGLVLGLIATIAVQIYVVPSIAASLPWSATPTPVPIAGPSQFGASELQRVLILDRSQERNGVTLRLSALEIYRDGLSMTYAMIASAGTASPPTLEPETFIVTDDRGTVYSLSPLGSTAAVSAGSTIGLVSFTPAPPADAQSLRVVVPSALALGRLADTRPRVIPGPWEFQIPLRA